MKVKVEKIARRCLNDSDLKHLLKRLQERKIGELDDVVIVKSHRAMKRILSLKREIKSGFINPFDEDYRTSCKYNWVECTYFDGLVPGWQTNIVSLAGTIYFNPEIDSINLYDQGSCKYRVDLVKANFVRSESFAIIIERSIYDDSDNVEVYSHKTLYIYNGR